MDHCQRGRYRAQGLRSKIARANLTAETRRRGERAEKIAKIAMTANIAKIENQGTFAADYADKR
jgi:hypothetical protein